MAPPVTALDRRRRPVVTLAVRADDISSPAHPLICHIDTGADPSLVLKTHQKALDLGIDPNDCSAFVGDPDAEVELADGSKVEYLVSFLYIDEWVDGRPRCVKVLIPPDPATLPPSQRRQVPSHSVGSAYQPPEALLGLRLLIWAEFRLNDSRRVVELLPIGQKLGQTP